MTLYDALIRNSSHWAMAYRNRDGSYSPGDIAHCSYRFLKEGWTHAQILADIERPGSITPAPPGPSLGIRSAFLLSHPYGYGYPGWDDEARTRYRVWMRGLNLTHLPFSPWCSDPRGAVFDYRTMPATFVVRCLELLDAGITPIIFAYTGDFNARDWSRDHLTRFWQGYAPGIPAGCQWCTGWEINDINDWTRSGQELGLWARTLANLVQQPVWVHWTPERWAGWPDFGGQGEQVKDEYQWWREFGPALRGILYQDSFDKPLGDVLERAFRIDSPHGYRPGIAGRIVDGCQKQFVLFEFARDTPRWTHGLEQTEPYMRAGVCHGIG